MKKILIMLVAAVIFSACSSTSVRGRDFNADNVALIKKQETTKQDLIRLFGQPYTVSILGDGTEQWVYQYIKATATPAEFSNDIDIDGFSKNLTIQLKDGTVYKYGYHYTPNL